MPTCIPALVGVPISDGAGGFSMSGPPRWWDSTGTLPAFNPRLEDPRWNGSTAITYPDLPGVSGETALLRAGYADDSGQRYLYLSWWVKADPALSASDALYVGFQSAAVAPIVYKIQRPSIVPPPPPPTPISGGSVTPYNGAATGAGYAWTNTGGASAPGWMSSSLRYWMVAASGATPAMWAVQFRVPIGAAGLDLGTSFRFMSYMFVQPALSGTAIVYRWPRSSSGFPTSTGFGDPTGPTWDTLELSAGGTCTTGVSLDAWNDIGVNEGTAFDGQIRITTGAPHPTNSFFARPLNNTPAAIPAQGIAGSFKIANWGSSASTAAGSWLAIAPNGVDVRDPNPSPLAVGSKAELAFAWQVLDPPIINAFVGPSPTRIPHQCVLVELSGAGLLFANQSAFRNMWVVNASAVALDAEINVAGLTPLPGTTHRETYLFVQALNMPTVLEEPIEPGGRSGPGEVNSDSSVKERRGLDLYSRFGLKQPVIFDSVAGTFAEPELNIPIHEQVPSYVVHVLHKTGETVEDGGNTYDLLEPQPSFGLLVDHQGALYGWDHALSGAVEVIPNFYKLPVPNNGSRRVSIRIEAFESPKSFWDRFLEWLLSLLKAFVMWIRTVLHL